MINKICRNPAINIVAGLAQIRGGYMTYRFTGSGHIVMARYTGLVTNQCMVHGGRLCRGFKTKRGMANFAGVGNRDVSGCYTHREYAIVALVALLGQLIEYAAYVARFAVNHTMGAGQWETRGQVVKGQGILIFVNESCGIKRTEKA